MPLRLKLELSRAALVVHIVLVTNIALDWKKTYINTFDSRKDKSAL